MSGEYGEYAEQRETLRAHRRVGRGSRGPRKPRKDGKPHTRSQSKSEGERAKIRLDTLARSVRGKFSEGDVKLADKFLKPHFPKAIDAGSVPALWKHINNEPMKLFVIRGDEQYRIAIDSIMSLGAKVMASDSFVMHCNLIEEALKSQPLNGNRKRRNIQIVSVEDLFAGIARLTIEFNEKKKADDRRRVSKLVACVRNLMAAGVKPGGVEAHYKKYGGGFDEWHRSPNAVNEKKKLTIEAAAVEIENSRKNYSAVEQYLDDLDSSESVPIASRAEHRLAKASGVGHWGGQTLQYYKREKVIGPEEGMVTLAAGDDGLVGVHIVGTKSIGPIPKSLTKQQELLVAIVKAAQAWQKEHSMRPSTASKVLPTLGGRPLTAYEEATRRFRELKAAKKKSGKGTSAKQVA